MRRLAVAITCALGWAVACGNSGANRLASSIVEAAADGIIRGGETSPGAFSSRRGRCFVFEAHGIACPVLPLCSALDEFREPVLANACDDGSQRIRPITTCRGWQGHERLCATGEFPRCSSVVGNACDRLELLVCEEGGEQRVARCCARGGDCPAESYVLVTLRQPGPSDPSDEAPPEPGEDGGNLAPDGTVDAAPP